MAFNSSALTDEGKDEEEAKEGDLKIDFVSNGVQKEKREKRKEK